MNTTSKRANSKKPKKTLVDRVYHEIQNRILYNIWGTGYQALEQELSEELGVSRTPVREALIRLQRDGLVKVVQSTSSVTDSQRSIEWSPSIRTSGSTIGTMPCSWHRAA